jgi:hypothetical protein
VATFELQGPDGGTYQVDAPDAETAVAVLHGGPSGPQPAPANPFNRTLGADQSFGAPLQSPIPTPDLDRAGELRAMMGGPVTDRMASAFQTYAPSILGGTGQDYGTNLATNRADTAAAQTAHPADTMAGEIAGTLPCGACSRGDSRCGAGGRRLWRGGLARLEQCRRDWNERA